MDVQPQEASLTVNEQVIVMSSHETIRVLEVGVDAPLPAEDDGKALEATAGEVASSCPVETSEPGREDVQPNLETTCGGTTGEVKSLPGMAANSVSSVTTFNPATSQPTQTLAPLAVQAAPQVLTQENLATVVTGVMVPAGAVTQPLLIPISIAGQVAGQQGLAVWTFPTATVAALPGLTAASPTGGIFKPPIANLQDQCSFSRGPNPAPQLTGRRPGDREHHSQRPRDNKPDPDQRPGTGHWDAALGGEPGWDHDGQCHPSCFAGPEPAGAGGDPAAAAERPRAGHRYVSQQRPPDSGHPETQRPRVPGKEREPQTPNTGIEEDGINLEEIREFAKNFKIRRLSLGLTQTQVGQALTATEGPAYSQSAICRFEKLDITPKSAQKLKPVLEKWLSEAELRNQEGQQNLMEFVGGEPSKKRKRRTSFTPQAIEALNAYFEKNALPTGQEITEIAKELNYDREVVRVWFCNRRQTLKNTSKLNVFQIP
uniref:POU domain protein n=1 Tax=Chrysemys picta bellii TaxID=8478 RepID=A0A8C3HY89_CHRPI